MDFIEEYKKRLKRAIAAEKMNRENAVVSLRFSDGVQWDEGEKNRRAQRGRPVLTGNLLEASIMQAVGDERHNHARVKVRSVSAHGDQKLAEIRSGIISAVEYGSNAESIYDYAHEMQCRGAYGAWRVLTRYCADNPFICEELLPGVEPGIDGATWEGDLIFPTQCGYERKGSGYIGRVYRREDELPEAMRVIHEGFAPEFAKYKTRFFYSTEIKIDKDRVPYLLDPTIRLAAPGVAAIQTELIENYSEVVYGFATGERVDPVMKHKYCAAVSMESSEASKTFVNITFPKEMRQWVKLRMAVKHKGDYYSVPPFDSMGVVISLGDSIRSCVEEVKERIKEVEAISLNTDLAGLDELERDIQEGKAYGINF